MKWQTVRVFISSTFRDMQAERDYLVKVVFPALRELLEPYRVHLIDIDLRWGVTKEQADNDQALDLCLQQIDECRPFFIGLLGERYGWVPTFFPQDALAHYGWIQHHNGKSITELEMLHGVLTNPQMQDHAFFYLRDPAVLDAIPEAIQQDIFLETDSERRGQLVDLKERIRSSGFPVLDPYPAQWEPKFYDPVNKVLGRVSGLHAFGQTVEQQLWEGIQAKLTLPDQPPTETQGESDTLAEEQDYHEHYMESRLRVYVGRETIQQRLLDYVHREASTLLLVTGLSGSGKSAVLAKLVQALSQRAAQPSIDENANPTIIVPHFIGASPGSTSLRQMLRRFCLILKSQFGFDDKIPVDLNELLTQFRKWVGQVPETSHVVFVLDALNQLDEADNAQAMYWLPRDLPPQVKVVVSCIVDPEKTEKALEAFEHLPHERINLKPLNSEERHAIVREVPSLSAKTLDVTQIEMLLANPATENPLFLLVTLEELRGFGFFEELNTRIAALPQEGDTVTGLFTQVIDRLTSEFDSEVVGKILAFLACSRNGLSQRELLELVEGDVEESTSDLFPIQRQLRPYLQHRGPLLDFYHRNLFKAVQTKYLDEEKSTQFWHCRLASYFQRKADPLGDRLMVR